MRYARVTTLLGVAFVGWLTLVSHAAQPHDDIGANLARVPRPWVNSMHQLTFPEYETTMKYWAAEHTIVSFIVRIFLRCLKFQN